MASIDLAIELVHPSPYNPWKSMEMSAIWRSQIRLLKDDPKIKISVLKLQERKKEKKRVASPTT